jgi:DNA-binding MarR family transcriptional regulator
MTDPEHPFCRCLFYAANALSRNITRLGEDAFGRMGLAPSLGFVLMTVNRKPGIQPSEVAEIMMLDPSTVTRLVEKLQGKDLVSRESQGRTTLIHPTAAGQALMPELLAAWEQIHQRYSAILGQTEAQALAGAIYEAALKLEQP